MDKLKWVKVNQQATSIVTFTVKVKVLAMFRDEHSSLDLKMSLLPRLAYMWLNLERLYEVKFALCQTVVSTYGMTRTSITPKGPMRGNAFAYVRSFGGHFGQLSL